VSESAESAAVLAEVEAKRGYVLPYHRMLAHTAPELLRAYDAFYERLTLQPRALTAAERETVWVALQAAAREEHGTIHLRRAERAGLSRADMARAVALAGVVESWVLVDFGTNHWADWTPPAELRFRYLDAFAAVATGVPEHLAEITAVVCHAARRTRPGMALHLARAFSAGATVDQVAEGLSYLLLPCGGPTLIDATAWWSEAAEAGGFPKPYP
jgi:alkylhydroperoxidase/carboxymuconolactone decarboxylase family protein YurZ